MSPRVTQCCVGSNGLMKRVIAESILSCIGTIIRPNHWDISGILNEKGLMTREVCIARHIPKKSKKGSTANFLELKYPPYEVKKQANKARTIPRESLLQDRPKRDN